MKKSGEIRQICQFRQIRQIRQIRQAWQSKHLNKHLRESDGRSAKVFADSRLADFFTASSRISNSRFVKFIPKPEYAFLVVFLFCAVVYAISIPAGAGADEVSHIARADQISHLGLVSERLDASQIDAADLPSSACELQDPENKARVESGQNVQSADKNLPERCYFYGGKIDSALYHTGKNNLVAWVYSDHPFLFPLWKDSRISFGESTGSEKIEAFSNSSVNNPFTYVPYVIAEFFAKIFTHNAYAVIICMRLGGVLFFAAAIFFCIRFLPFGKWVLAAVACLPSAMAVNAMVTADMVTFVADTAFLTVLLAFLNAEKLSKAHWIWLTAASLGVACSKLTYLPFVMLVALVPIIRKDCRDLKTWLKLFGICAGSGIAFLMWYVKIKDINTGIMFRTTIDPEAQKKFMSDHPGEFLKYACNDVIYKSFLSIREYGAASSMPFREVRNFGGFFVQALFFASIFARDSREKVSAAFSLLNRFIAVLFSAAVFAIVSVLIESALYMQYSDPGQPFVAGVQTRYFLSIVFLFALMASMLFRASVKKSPAGEGEAESETAVKASAAESKLAEIKEPGIKKSGQAKHGSVKYGKPRLMPLSPASAVCSCATLVFMLAVAAMNLSQVLFVAYGIKLP